jgi:hypothetical protein
VTGLTNSKHYTCTVAATNSHGTGPPSSNAAARPGIATAPRALTATIVAGHPNWVQLAFTPPVSTGGFAIDHYNVSCTGGGQFDTTGPSSPIVDIVGTAPGTVKCSIVAVNGMGTGPSASVGGIFVYTDS